MENFQANDKEIRDVFSSNNIYYIPQYQRPYAWSKDEAEEMWDDLCSERSLFFGSFVFNTRSTDSDPRHIKKIEIVDGQQRLTTINILLTVLRKKLLEIGDQESIKLAERIFQKISFTSDTSANSPTIPRVHVNETIKEVFNQTIQNESWDGVFPSQFKKDKNAKRIKEIFDLFSEKLNKHIEEEKSDSKDAISKILDTLYGSKIIWIEVKSDEDAYFIFETMNARGADLTAADLLKNYIFSTLHQNELPESVIADWETITNNLTGISKMTMSKFIRYFWLSNQDFVTEKNLYREIKKSNLKPETLLSSLKEASEIFKLLSVGTPDDWKSYLRGTSIESNYEKIFLSLQGLNLFGTTQCFVLFLCLLTNKDKVAFDFSYIFEDIEKFHFIYSAISAQPGNKVEKLYSATSKQINETVSKDLPDKKETGEVNRILAEMKDKLPKVNFETFNNNFSEISYGDPLVKYIFDRQNRFLAKATKATAPAILTNRDYDIEHILPKDPTNWGLDKKNSKDFVHSIGNLIVIDRRINGSMQNITYDQKIEWFAKSKLHILEAFIDEYKNKSWTKESIKERTENLAELAFGKIWKIN
jgi:uncharacterized protein with ParB-like and HNH nuclease domain